MKGRIDLFGILNLVVVLGFLPLLAQTKTFTETTTVSPPTAIAFQGDLGYVARLADGRLFAVHGECRPQESWHDASIPQPVFGRFSTDAGLTWSAPQVLFHSPGAGWLHTILPLGSRDGAIHLFGLSIHHFAPPIDWTRASADIWHAVSHDGGKMWQPPLKIDWGHRYSGQLNSGIQLKSGRIVIAFSYLDEKRPTGYFISHTIYSDDGGRTWRPSKNDVPMASGGKRLESGAAEPVIAQLPDGRLWMVIRTQTGYLFESFSRDDAETWSPAQRTIFRASNAPAAVLEADGRLYLAWNNEIGEPFSGSVSYSRQSLVLAVKEGSTWKGYRQINTPFAPEDLRGVARYPFLAGAQNGLLLVGFREDGRESAPSRKSKAACTTYWNGGTRLFLVDPRWLLETEAREDFSQGLQNVQASGSAGAEVLAGPAGRPALRLRKIKNDQPSAVTWNFPLGRKGSLQIWLQIEPGFQGAHMTLSEYYLRPSNLHGGSFRVALAPDGRVKTQYVNEGPFLSVDEKDLLERPLKVALEPGRVHQLSIEWDCDTNIANLSIDGQYAAPLVGLEPAQGVAYLRIASPAVVDDKGFWILSLRSHSAP